MSRSNARRAVGPLILVLAACAESEPVGLPAAEEPATDLSVVVPRVAPEQLARISMSTVGDPSTAPLFSEDEGGGNPELTMVRTVVGFTSDGAYSQASQRFKGHAGRVETTAHVAFNDQPLGSQTAVEQRSFWLDLRLEKFLSAYAFVRTDKSCGLSVEGDSRHSAWWEIPQIKNVTEWGHAHATSGDGPKEKADCRKMVTSNDPTGEYTASTGIVCYYLITYDIDTHEIVGVELLSCSSSHGEEL